MDALSSALRKHRMERGLTQTDVANLLHIKLRQYANYEKDHWPPHDQLIKLNNIFNYHFEQHIYGKGTKGK